MQFYEFTHFRTELSLYLRLEKDKALQKIQVMDLTIPPSINWKKKRMKKNLLSQRGAFFDWKFPEKVLRIWQRSVVPSQMQEWKKELEIMILFSRLIVVNDHLGSAGRVNCRIPFCFSEIHNNITRNSFQIL